MLTALVAVAALPRVDLQSRIGALLEDPALKRASVGIEVREIGGSVIFARGADKRLMPASVMKLVTAATVLDFLSPRLRPTTTVWRDGKGTYLIGGADPGLTYAELIKLGAQTGSREGQTVYFDDSLLGPERIGSGWEFGDLGDGYAAPISALTVNRGAVEVWLANGAPTLRPRNFGLRVRSERSEGDLRVQREFGGLDVAVSGRLPTGPSKLGTISMPDPALCAASTLGKPVRRLGLSPPPTAVRFAPRTVGDLLRTCLVESDNVYAETLLRLAGKVKGKSGSWRDSLALSAETLTRVGVGEDEYRLADGSGLSRFNEIAATAITKLLEAKADALSALMPGPGEGTLKGRLDGLPVRAKTGTLTGASCIAGIIEGNGNRIVFAIMMNHYPGKAARIREIQDAIIRAICEEMG
jgi:D-alanyl-D-alanine carboxypeptidase/D-alanyl-D-alanine-endopeptidase (penicillin-binding protein 4)